MITKTQKIFNETILKSAELCKMLNEEGFDYEDKEVEKINDEISNLQIKLLDLPYDFGEYDDEEEEYYITYIKYAYSPVLTFEKYTTIYEKGKGFSEFSGSTNPGLLKKKKSATTTKLGICCHCQLVAKWCPTLCNPMGCSTPGFPVLHHLLEFVQIHAH